MHSYALGGKHTGYKIFFCIKFAFAQKKLCPYKHYVNNSKTDRSAFFMIPASFTAEHSWHSRTSTREEAARSAGAACPCARLPCAGSRPSHYTSSSLCARCFISSHILLPSFPPLISTFQLVQERSQSDPTRHTSTTTARSSQSGAHHFPQAYEPKALSAEGRYKDKAM